MTSNVRSDGVGYRDGSARGGRGSSAAERSSRRPKDSPPWDRRERLIFTLACALLVIAFALGGSSRADALSQLPVRLGALLAGGAAVYLSSWESLRVVRFPLLLCGGWALLMGVQLVPLPPEAWLALPRRDQFADLASIAGIAQPWRPISLVPHATANSLLAMIVPLAVLITVGQVAVQRYSLLLLVVILLAVVSGALGAAQVASDGALSLYRISNHGNATGFFANHNHHAAWMAAMVPVLAGFSTLPHARLRESAAQSLLLIAFVLIFPLIFITGSRSGLVLLALGILLAGVIFGKVSGWNVISAKISKRTIALLMAGIVVATLALILFRVGGVERILTQDAQEDLRVSTLPVVTRLATSYFPFGGGFGTFPELYKIDEPLSALSFQYFNHAHNDLLEIIIEGGAPAVALLLIFLGWFGVKTTRIWRTPIGNARTAHILGLIGSAGLLILFSASLVDYPLRTPALAAFAAILVTFIAAGDSALSSARLGAKSERSAQIPAD